MRTISVPVIATVLGLCAALCLSQPVSTFSRAPVLADRNNDPRRVGKPPPTRPVRSNCANAAKVRAGSYVLLRQIPLQASIESRSYLTDNLSVFQVHSHAFPGSQHSHTSHPWSKSGTMVFSHRRLQYVCHSRTLRCDSRPSYSPTPYPGLQHHGGLH